MTYFGFLILFLVLPLALLAGLLLYRHRQGRALPSEPGGWMPWGILLAHVFIAVAYTTPWDNYLVANRVWWYDPELVSGIVLGWVPLEEYSFFVLQTLLAGMWLFYLAGRIDLNSEAQYHYPQLRWIALTTVIVLLVVATALLVAAWQPATYLALILVWAAPPLAIQLGFGADILWRYRRLVLLSLAPSTLFLSAADALAISAGTWTINPAYSLELYLGGVLPLEEFIFFLVTNTLITFGLVLGLAHQSKKRLRSIARFIPFQFVNKATAPNAPGHSSTNSPDITNEVKKLA